jgi:hypothetical protein
MPTPAALALMPMPSYGNAQQKSIRWEKIEETDVSKRGGEKKKGGERGAVSRVGNFRQKNNSAEDGIDGTNYYFRRNSGCSAEQKISEFRSEPFRGRENNSEFRSVEPK